MSTSPDSALALVQGIDGASLPTSGLRARHALLLTMAQDKCYINAVEDSTIQVAYDYYHHRTNKRYRLLSTYYLGVIRQNAGEFIDAALVFREAEPLAEELEDYRQLSLIEQHLSRIFALNYDHVRALEHAERALDAAEKADEELMADYCRYDIAVQLLAEYQFEKADSVLSDISLSRITNSTFLSKIAKKKAEARLYKSEPDIEWVRTCYLDLIRQGICMNSHDYGILALLSEKERNSQDADTYLQKAERMILSSIDSMVFYNDSRNVYDCRGDWKKAHYSKTESVRIQDRMTIDLLSQSVTHAMENYYQDKLVISRLQSRIHLIACGLIGILLLTLLILLMIMIKKRDRQLLADMVAIEEVSRDVNRLRAGESASFKVVNSLIADKVYSLQRLSESYFSWDDAAVKRREEKSGMLLRNDIISSFRAQLNDLRSDCSFIMAIEQSLNLTEDGIMEKARRVLPDEKELDFSILTLLFSGFSIKSISYLLRMSEPSLRMRKTRYKQQFELCPDPIRTIFLDKIG